MLQRKIDEVPSRTELAQYQRRFIELYNQGKMNLIIAVTFAKLYPSVILNELILKCWWKHSGGINT